MVLRFAPVSRGPSCGLRAVVTARICQPVIVRDTNFGRGPETIHAGACLEDPQVRALSGLVRRAVGGTGDRNGYSRIRAGFTNPIDMQRTVAERRNRATLVGANYFRSGWGDPARSVVDAYATKRPRQRPWRRHRAGTGKHVRYPDGHPCRDTRLMRLTGRTASMHRAKAWSLTRASLREFLALGSMCGSMDRGQSEDRCTGQKSIAAGNRYSLHP